MPYTYLFSALSDNFQAIMVNGGYPFLFFTVLLEGIPLLGTIVPGHITIIAGGFFAKIGIFDLGWVIAISLTAALIGDFIGFYLGRRYGLAFIDRMKLGFLVKPTHIARAQKLLDTHPGKAMIFGRMSPVTRAIMPFLVGAGKTSVQRFWFFNVIGGIIWVASSIAIGYVFGASYHIIAGYFGKLIVGVIIVSIAIIWAYRIVNTYFDVFRRYELFVLGLNVASLLVLAEMIQDSWSQLSFMAPFDISVSAYMATLTHAMPWLASLAFQISDVGGLNGVLALGVGTAMYFALKKKWRSSVIVLASLGSAYVLCTAMKEFFGRYRPDIALVKLYDFSFPSGHATMAAVLFTVLAYLFAPKIKNWIWRESFIVLCALAAIAVGLSRIVLNVHWASDVIAGWSLGILCATGCILAIRYIGSLVTHKVK